MQTEKSAIPTLELGGRIWMAEDLDINVPGSVLNANGGRVYNWDEALKAAEILSEQTGETWVVASDDEFKQIEIAMGMSKEDADDWGYRDSGEVGTKLKEGGESGLNLLLGGREYGGSYGYLGSWGGYWTSTEYAGNTSGAWMRYVNSGNTGVYRDWYNKAYRYSVRCVKVG